MGIKTMASLETDINIAYELGFKYFAVKVEMDGFPEDEVIINPIENAIEKLEYYKKVYNEDLTHKHSSGIRIVDSTFADTYDEIERDFSVDLNDDIDNVMHFIEDIEEEEKDSGEW